MVVARFPEAVHVDGRGDGFSLVAGAVHRTFVAGSEVLHLSAEEGIGVRREAVPLARFVMEGDEGFHVLYGIE